MAACLFSNNISGQTYYGDNGQGKFVVLNDSIGIGYFLAGLGVDHWIWRADTFSLRRSNDTLYISSLNPKQWVHLYKSDTNLKIESVSYLSSITLYNYFAGVDSWWLVRTGGWRDIVTGKTFVKDIWLAEGWYIIVNEYVVGSDRYSFYCDSSGRYDIGIDFDYKMRGVMLKDMPLLVKGKKLIPASDSLQALCWAENGFFLPEMTKNKKTIYVKPLSILSQGDNNLPNKREKNFMPSRYSRYLNTKLYH